MVWLLSKCLEQLKLDYPDIWQSLCFGRICKHGHEFHESGRGLRRKVNDSCYVCYLLGQKQYRIKNLEKEKQRHRNYHQKNKEKANQVSRLYFYENQDRCLENHRNWAKENPEKCQDHKRVRRAKQAKTKSDGGGYTATLYTIFDRCCAYCGKALKLSEVQLEHVRPVKFLGDSVYRNFVPSCRSCNSSKHAKCLLLWYPYQSFFCPIRLARIVDHCSKK